jgi:hypothetical protein
MRPKVAIVQPLLEARDTPPGRLDRVLLPVLERIVQAQGERGGEYSVDYDGR